MITIKQQITFLPTDKLTDMEHFYADIVGLKKVLEQADCMIFKVTHSAYIGFCSRSVDSPPDRIILTLVTDEVDQLYADLLAKGAVCEAEPVQNEKYRIYHFFIKDPSGYLVEVQQFLDGFDEP